MAGSEAGRESVFGCLEVGGFGGWWLVFCHERETALLFFFLVGGVGSWIAGSSMAGIVILICFCNRSIFRVSAQEVLRSKLNS